MASLGGVLLVGVIGAAFADDSRSRTASRSPTIEELTGPGALAMTVAASRRR